MCGHVSVSVLRFPESFTAHARCICTNDCRHSCGSCCGSTTAAHTGEWGVPTPSCLALCLWRAEGGGELLGAVRLPLAYGEADNLRLNGRKATLGGPDRDVEDLPGVLFCGSDLVVTAGPPSQRIRDFSACSLFLVLTKVLTTPYIPYRSEVSTFTVCKLKCPCRSCRRG